MTTSSSPTPGSYLGGYNATFTDTLSTRRLVDSGSFILPYLRSGIRLLDVGCGPGSMTCDLAAAIAPGEVVGVDLEPSQVEATRHRAADAGLTNLRVEQGDVYALPFPDASFDVVFAHAVLQHLRDSQAALREFRRVLRPGGVVGIRDGTSTYMMDPTATGLRAYTELLTRAATYMYGPARLTDEVNRRAQLHETGFVAVEMAVEPTIHGSHCTAEKNTEYVRLVMDLLREHHGGGPMGVALAQGWVDQITLDQWADQIQAWAVTPGAFHVHLWVTAIGKAKPLD